MNDLNTEGCTFRAANEAWSVEEVIRGVEQLAGLHGQYWGAKVEDHPCKQTRRMLCLSYLAGPRATI